MKNNRFPIILVALLAIVLGVIVSKSSLLEGEKTTELAVMKIATVLPTAKPLNNFSLIDHNGVSFTKESLKNKHSVLFFGFTNCPDICPITLQFLKTVKKSMVESGDWDKFQVVFISVDPERDTPEKLNQYVPYFDKEFIGVTGTTETMALFAKQLAMPYIIQEKDENGHYNVDHSASLIVTDRQGNMKAIISPPHTKQEMVDDLLTIAEGS
jgi:protein SCO1/2